MKPYWASFKNTAVLLSCLGAGCASNTDTLEGGKDALQDTVREVPLREVTLAEIELARVDAPDGRYVGWYEPGPGLIVTLQGGPANIPPLPVDSSLSPTKQFQSLAKGRPVPVAFRDAEKRVEAAAAEPRRPPPANRPPESDFRESSADGQDFKISKAVDDACPWSWASAGGIRACTQSPLDEWEVYWSFGTGDSNFTRNDNDVAWVAACAFQGAITYVARFRKWYSWETKISTTVSQGQWAGYSVGNSQSIDFDIYSQVTNGAGKGYHHCGSGGHW